MSSNNRELYVGLMSGTSLDGIDCLLAEFKNHTFTVLQASMTSFPDEVRDELSAIINQPGLIDVDRLGVMSTRLAGLYADAVLQLLATAGVRANDIRAIGCHGQTVRHQPAGSYPFTMQLVNGAALANITGLPVVSDFRSADIALGGEGAPLASGFHRWAFHCADETRAVVNIGGIANISLLKSDNTVSGFDTGPGNTLLDAWIQRHQDKPYDAMGQWAASADPHSGLLQQFLNDPYFSTPPPKSTGREYFNPDWLDVQLATFGETLDPAVVQATLAELTVSSIASSLREAAATTIAICGGGARNDHLMLRLQDLLPDSQLTTTATWGLDPDWVEAAAFAWLARARINQQPGNIPSVTGATAPAILGAVYLPPPQS